MFKNIAVVIPALDNNQYYSDGDLVRFGDTTLLEWKISQILGVTGKENIYVSTPSDKIIDLVQSYGVNLIEHQIQQQARILGDPSYGSTFFCQPLQGQ